MVPSRPSTHAIVSHAIGILAIVTHAVGYLASTGQSLGSHRQSLCSWWTDDMGVVSLQQGVS